MDKQAFDGSKTGYLDILRVLALSAVILLHVVTGVSDTIPQQMTLFQLKVYEVIRRMASVGVPLFLMISGTLFLAPEKKLTIRRLLSGYILRIFLVLAIFGTAYALIEMMIRERARRLSMPAEAFVNMLRGDTWAHMWYLYLLPGLYFMIPFFKEFTAHANQRIYEYLLAVLFIGNSVLPFMKKTFGIDLGIQFPVAGIYTFYYMCGYYLHRYRRREPGKAIWPQLAVIAFCIFMYSINMIFELDFDMNYDSPFVVIPAIAVFHIASGVRHEVPFCTRCRRSCFPMYLVHTIFLNVSYKMLHITPLLLGGYLLIPLFFAATAVLSYAAAYILQRIWPMRRLFA